MSYEFLKLSDVQDEIPAPIYSEWVSGIISSLFRKKTKIDPNLFMDWSFHNKLINSWQDERDRRGHYGASLLRIFWDFSKWRLLCSVLFQFIGIFLSDITLLGILYGFQNDLYSLQFILIIFLIKVLEVIFLNVGHFFSFRNAIMNRIAFIQFSAQHTLYISACNDQVIVPKIINVLLKQPDFIYDFSLNIAKYISIILMSVIYFVFLFWLNNIFLNIFIIISFGSLISFELLPLKIFSICHEYLSKTFIKEVYLKYDSLIDPNKEKSTTYFRDLRKIIRKINNIDLVVETLINFFILILITTIFNLEEANLWIPFHSKALPLTIILSFRLKSYLRIIWESFKDSQRLQISLNFLKEIIIYKKIIKYESLKPRNDDDIYIYMSESFFKWNDKIYIYPNNQNSQLHIHNELMTLKKISFTALKNHHLGIYGRPGSGKSSLLFSFMGHLDLINSNSVHCCGRLAYVGQRPFLLNAGSKENIEFFNEQDDSRYEEIIQCLELELIDLMNNSSIKSQSLFEIKNQLIELARAIYANCDIYLLDDPLNTLDCRERQKLLEKCFTNFFPNKIVIMTTQRRELMDLCNKRYLLKENYLIQYLENDSEEIGNEISDEIQSFQNNGISNELNPNIFTNYPRSCFSFGLLQIVLNIIISAIPFYNFWFKWIIENLFKSSAFSTKVCFYLFGIIILIVTILIHSGIRYIIIKFSLEPRKQKFEEKELINMNSKWKHYSSKTFLKNYSEKITTLLLLQIIELLVLIFFELSIIIYLSWKFIIPLCLYIILVIIMFKIRINYESNINDEMYTKMEYFNEFLNLMQGKTIFQIFGKYEIFYKRIELFCMTLTRNVFISSTILYSVHLVKDILTVAGLFVCFYFTLHEMNKWIYVAIIIFFQIPFHITDIINQLGFIKKNQTWKNIEKK